MATEDGDTRRDDRAALALLAGAMRPDAVRSGWTVAGLVLAGLLEAAGPLFGKHLIDTQLVPLAFDPRAAGLLVAGLVAAGWSASLLRYVALIRLARVAMRSVERLRNRVHAHVLALPMAWFDRAITGQLVSRITNDTEQIRQLYVQVLFEVLQGLTLMAGAIAAMAWLDWRLMLIVLTLGPVMVVIVRLYRRLSAAAVARSRELRSDINAQVAEGIAGMAVLQASGAAGRAAARFDATNDAHYASRQREVRANAWLLRPALDFVNLLLIVAALATFGLLNASGDDVPATRVVEVGLLYAFISYIGRVVDPLIQITQQFSMLQQALVCASRLDRLLGEPLDGTGATTREAASTGPQPRPQGRPAARLDIRAVDFGYRPDRPVLHGIDLSIAPGEFIGIVGHTGAGKSSLLALLLRFYAPTAGRIEIDGVALERIPDDRYRADVGLVPQEPFLLAGTARENIDMGRSLAASTIRAAAAAAGADRFIDALDAGEDTPLGEGGARLSAGEKELLAIARALAGSPRLLLLDEATARVDSETERRVSAAVAALRGRVSVVAIAHRLSTVREADRIVVLDHGRIAQIGTHAQLAAVEGGIYRRLLQMQQLEDPPPADADDRSAS
ncbi:MAG: ABC transporter ATP-binding protein [Lautropia sp.]